MITEKDKEAFSLIKKCGFVRIDYDGEPCLETYSQISRFRFRRLVAHGLLKPGGDSMFGLQPQTYIPNEETDV